MAIKSIKESNASDTGYMKTLDSARIPMHVD